jgi:hypothetical protein
MRKLLLFLLITLPFYSCQDSSLNGISHNTLIQFHSQSFTEQNDYLTAQGYDYTGLNSIFVNGSADPNSPLWQKFDTISSRHTHSVYKKKMNDIVWSYSFLHDDNELSRIQTFLESDGYVKTSKPQRDDIHHSYDKEFSQYAISLTENPGGCTLRVVAKNNL